MTTGQSLILAGWTLTITQDGAELTAPKGKKIDLMRLEMVNESQLPLTRSQGLARETEVSRLKG